MDGRSRGDYAPTDANAERLFGRLLSDGQVTRGIKNKKGYAVDTVEKIRAADGLRC
jgi:hypothetical protein